jgi:hypothetical protein
MAFMTAALPYIMGAGAVMSAISSIQQGKAAKSAGDYNAQINEQNSQLALEQSQRDAAQVGRANYLRRGALIAAGGASGTKQEGSVLDILADVGAQGELEKQNVLYGGQLASRGYLNTASLDRAQGKNARTSSYYKAGSELLTGGAMAGEMYGRKSTPKYQYAEGTYNPLERAG